MLLLSKDHFFVDIDECNERSHSCHEDQICVNIRGGHRCACRRGFRMRDGDRKCIGRKATSFNVLLMILIDLKLKNAMLVVFYFMCEFCKFSYLVKRL